MPVNLIGNWGVTGGVQQELPFPVSTTLVARTPDTLAKPAYLSSVVDSAFPGVKITRVSNDTNFGVTGSYVIDTGYSKRQPWSRNGTWLRIGTRHLLDGNTYAYQKLMDTSYKLWSNVTDDKMYCFYKAGNVRVYRPSTQSFDVGNVVDLSTLPGFDATFNMSVGENEGNISNDDTRVILNIKQSGVIRNVVVNLVTGAIVKNYSDADLDIGIYSADWVTVSPDGQYIIVNELTSSGTTENKRAYNLDTGALFQSNLGNLSHRDTGYGVSGEQVLVGTNPPSSYNILTGVGITLLPLTDIQAVYGASASAAGHSSGRAFNLPGWMLYSMTNTNLTYREIMWIKTDGSKQLMRVCNARLNNAHDLDGPQAAPNWDGTKVLFASDWDNGSGPVDAYIAEVV